MRFEIGDRVALSARFLRSMGTDNFAGGNSGLSRHDRGKGTVLGVVISDMLVFVWFDRGDGGVYNVFNLVAERDIHREATRSENIGIRKIL